MALPISRRLTAPLLVLALLLLPLPALAATPDDAAPARSADAPPAQSADQDRTAPSGDESQAARESGPPRALPGRTPADKDPDGFLGALDELFAPTAVLSDLGRMVSGPASGDLAILGSGLGLSLASIESGGDTATFNDGDPRLGVVGDSMSLVGRRTILYPALVGTFAAGKLLDAPGVSGTAAELTQAVLVTDLIVGPMKRLSGRLRPDGNGNSSYPSGHTAAAFAVATVVHRRFGAGAGIPAYALAAVMGASRVDQRRHFLSDVLAGAAIGVVAARTVGRRFEGHSIALHPVVGTRGGSGLGVTIQF